jgi:type II secretory pathway component PulJ
MPEIFDFPEEVESRHREMLDDLDSINIDDLKSEGVTLSFGGKTFKFTDLEIIQDESIEERLRKEFKEKLNVQQQRIRDKINSKINQLLLMHQNKQQELDRKEQQMKKKYSEAAMMPDITEAHMLKGLSVVKGSSNDELVWVYRAVYNPRFIVLYNSGRGTAYDGSRKVRKAIPSRLVNRMKKDILLIIKTKGKQVTTVATKELVSNGRNLPVLQHYHQTGNGDCWGSWRYDKSWSTPDDIIKIAKDAEAVLETINQGSLASRAPTGLPRIQTLLNAVEKLDEEKAQTVERENSLEDDVWQAV